MQAPWRTRDALHKSAALTRSSWCAANTQRSIALGQELHDMTTNDTNTGPELMSQGHDPERITLMHTKDLLTWCGNSCPSIHMVHVPQKPKRPALATAPKQFQSRTPRYPMVEQNPPLNGAALWVPLSDQSCRCALG